MRCLGIDYGTRRIGLSYGDELGVATPLPALTEADETRRWAGLLEVARGRRVTDLVVGHPLNMDDTAGPKAKEAEAFAARLGAELGLPGEKRCHDLPLPRRKLERRHVYRCPHCKLEVPRVKPLRRKSACLACCRAHAGGSYDERFRLVKLLAK